MRLIKLGLATPNPTVGAFRTNMDKILKLAHRFAADNCTIVAFPEQSISGYPAEDLVQWGDFVDQQNAQLERFCSETEQEDTIFVLGITVRHQSQLYNCAVVVNRGEIVGIVPKQKLPTYNVFYEDRIFSRWLPGRFDHTDSGIPIGDMIFCSDFITFGVEVCEDIWSPTGPMSRRVFSGAELIVNISASPWRNGVTDTRKEMIATRSSDNQVVVAYVNEYGGNDSLVFDGGGYVYQNGRPIEKLPRWSEASTTVVVDMDETTRLREQNTTWRTDCRDYLQSVELGNDPKVISILMPGTNPESFVLPLAGELPYPNTGNLFMPDSTNQIMFFTELLQACGTGLDYLFKTKAFRKIGIALSGGKDSVLTLLLVHFWLTNLLTRDGQRPDGFGEEELRPENFINCFSFPTVYNSDTTRNIARTICQELGVRFVEIPIQDQYEAEVAKVKAMLADSDEITPITLQNIQARIRSAHMWNWSNSSRGMWLQTGNMSETSVGYMTVGADLMGSLSLIGNLPKTVIVKFIEQFAKMYTESEALKQLLTTVPSAELSEGQEDEKDLMPYEVLDNVLYLFVGKRWSPLDIYDYLSANREDKYTREQLKQYIEKFVRLFFNSIYKWVQAPQSLHLGSLHLDRERCLQIPAVQSREWLEHSLQQLREA